MCNGVGRVGDEGRDGTEIDIMEKPWLDDRVQHTFHWDGYGKDHKSEGKVVKVPGVMKGWHTFGLLWLPDQYVFYVDGKETWRTKAGGVSQVPEYMLLSDEVGQWGGDIRKAKLPDAVPGRLRAGVRFGGVAGARILWNLIVPGVETWGVSGYNDCRKAAARDDATVGVDRKS